MDADFIKSQGFNENGETWVILGDTYPIRDILMEAGAKYNPVLGMHFSNSEAAKGYMTLVVNIEDICEKDFLGGFEMRPDAKSIVDKMKRKAIPSSSKHVGNVGDSFEMTLFFNKKVGFNGPFGYCNAYTFADEDGNVIVGFSKEDTNLSMGDEVQVVGMIKEHKEYDGVKQTVLTRWKILPSNTAWIAF